MRRSPLWLLLTAAIWCSCAAVQAEQHRATYLGNPETRFAPPLKTPDDLRAMFLDSKLKKDMASVLSQWGWHGDLADFYRSGLTSRISAITIPVGSTMPFMSSREKGRPICLRNVLWAGEEPAPAYAFNFQSKGQRYRCVTPKACSNFFLEDLGPEPDPELALTCVFPEEVLAGHPVRACLELRNPGESVEPMATVRLRIPDGATFLQATPEFATTENNSLVWRVPQVGPKAALELCAVFAARQPGTLSFTATATGEKAKPVQTSCTTAIRGVPAILLEVIDLEDPLQVGEQVTYQVDVTNQGTAPGTNIRVVCVLPECQEFISGEGATPLSADGRRISAGVLGELAPKTVASWRLLVKAVKPADARFKVELSSDQFQLPIQEEESTELY